MLYAEVQKRKLTSDYSQYKFFRKENNRIFEYLRRFPILPRSQRASFFNMWDFGRFFLHKISYLVEPQLKVYAYLLVPKQMDARVGPGILALHQHNDEYKAGKSEVIGLVEDPAYTKLRAVHPDPSHKTPKSKRQFAYGKELCERGFVVLAPDFIGFEEYRDSNWELDDYYSEPGFIRGYEEMLSEKYLLHGSCLLAKHIHDLYVAVSVLTSIDNVDSGKIGVIGHSLGGEMASMIMAFDSRVKAGVSSCGTFSYEDFETSNRMETAETIIPNFRSDNRDFDFILDMIPPKPFLSINGEKDIGSAGQKLLKKRRENFEVAFHKGGHEFPSGERNRAYSFLQKNFGQMP
jgi:hypothetical protein